MLWDSCREFVWFFFFFFFCEMDSNGMMSDGLMYGLCEAFDGMVLHRDT